MPAIAATVTTRTSDADLIAFVRQDAVVTEVHAVVAQTTVVIHTVCVGSEKAKLSPETVTKLPPLATPFNLPYDTMAASNDHVDPSVPAIAATVTCVCALEYAAGRAVERQDTLVELDQEAVEQVPAVKAVVAEKSAFPKLRPLTVTELAPLEIAFNKTDDATGESNE